jgi:hypothetical protein
MQKLLKKEDWWHENELQDALAWAVCKFNTLKTQLRDCESNYYRSIIESLNRETSQNSHNSTGVAQPSRVAQST